VEAFKEYTVPLSGLKPGPHVYSYSVDSEFFRHFEASPIQSGQFDILITLDRRADMATLDFDIRGHYNCLCDRCLADIQMPINALNQLIIKFEEGDDTDEVIYVEPQESEWNAATVIYEFICLGRPLSNTFECDGRPCNQDLLKKLNQLEEMSRPEKESVWESLKNIKLN
jgi:uncharacterized protein